MKKLKYGAAGAAALVLTLLLSSCAPETKEADMGEGKLFTKFIMKK